jgi:uncharacterized SAM-binding protein YcdF (DUF218 family)
MRVWTGVAIGGAVGWLCAAALLDAWGHRVPPDGPYDLIVVAGCRVRPDGTPSLALQRRTDAAVSLWRSGLAPRVVFTGGVGDYPPSEASVAARHAVTLGLPPSAIGVEERSTSTEENARFAALEHPAQRVLVVTDSYHVFRAERVFARHYPVARGVGSAPALWVRAKGSAREVGAVLYYGLTGRL